MPSGLTWPLPGHILGRKWIVILLIIKKHFDLIAVALGRKLAASSFWSMRLHCSVSPIDFWIGDIQVQDLASPMP